MSFEGEFQESVVRGGIPTSNVEFFLKNVNNGKTPLITDTN